MTEPTVPVPVSMIWALIEKAQEGHKHELSEVIEVRALLSQPTPTATAEPPRIEDMAPRTTENPEGWPYSVAPDGAERCGVAFLGYEKGDGSCEYLPGHPGRHWSTQWGSWSL